MSRKFVASADIIYLSLFLFVTDLRISETATYVHYFLSNRLLGVGLPWRQLQMAAIVGAAKHMLFMRCDILKTT